VKGKSKFPAQLLTVGALGFLAACSQPPARAPALPRTLEVIKLDEEALHRLRQQDRGRVLLLNFWATWCEPCREEFPALVRLYHAYHAHGLDLAAISMDEPESRPAIQEFLKLQGAEFGSYLHDFRDFAALVDAVNPRWGGGIPATFLYDRDGKLVQSWGSATSFEEFDRQVRPLLR
jgi:thiol-disulfide isomerase/thioredoxin